MAATIKIKNSSTANAKPTSSDLVQGELAINVTDKKIFTEDSGGNVVELGANFNGFKNRIINGAMMIDQRNAGASVTPTNGQYLVDRWYAGLTQASKFTVQQSSTAPTGFTKSLLVTSSSAYSVGSGDTFLVGQTIEGYNCADLAWGTSSASTVTLSFWVRSSLTGTFGGSINAADGATYSYPFSYTISAANTWEQKTVTIAGPTSTWSAGTTNNGAIQVRFGLGSGATYSGTAGSWAASNYIQSTSSTSVVGTNGATFYITGVQLEKGSTATSFDYRSYGTELALCQRYFYKTNPENTYGCGGLSGCYYDATGASTFGTLPVVMRSAPTITRGGTNNTFFISGVSSSGTGTFSGTYALAATTNYWVEIGSLNSSAKGQPLVYNGQLSFSAEL